MGTRNFAVTWSSMQPMSENSLSTVPPEGGVYRLMHLSGDKNFVHYVGKALDLRARLRDHLPENELNPCNARKLRDFYCQFQYAVWPSASDRDDLEWWLYDYFKPTCNEREPGHSGRYDTICVNPNNGSETVCRKVSAQMLR